LIFCYSSLHTDSRW